MQQPWTRTYSVPPPPRDEALHYYLPIPRPSHRCRAESLPLLSSLPPRAGPVIPFAILLPAAVRQWPTRRSPCCCCRRSCSAVASSTRARRFLSRLSPCCSLGLTNRLRQVTCFCDRPSSRLRGWPPFCALPRHLLALPQPAIAGSLPSTSFQLVASRLPRPQSTVALRPSCRTPAAVEVLPRSAFMIPPPPPAMAHTRFHSRRRPATDPPTPPPRRLQCPFLTPETLDRLLGRRPLCRRRFPSPG